MKIRYVLAFFLSIDLALPARSAEPAPLPADLAAVPADAVGFVHIRVADIWKSELLKDFRETTLKAGVKALQGFDTRFLPHPSSIERLTIVLVPSAPPLHDPFAALGIIALNKPLDRAAALKTTFPKAVEHKTTNGSFFSDEQSKLAVSFLDDKTVVCGQTPAVEAFIDKRARPNVEMIEALRAANSNRHVTISGRLIAIEDDVIAEVPGVVRPLLTAKLAIVSLDVAPNAQIDASLHYADARSCSAANLALQNLAKMGKDEIKKAREQMLKKVFGDGKFAPLDELPETALALVALGSFERIDEILANPPIKREGNTLVASVKIPNVSGLIGLSALGAGALAPLVQEDRERAAEWKRSGNLKEIGLALHNFEAANGFLPPAAICDKNGKPLLSWRVAILPYIEQGDLYNQLKLDEPWDSEHNKKLIQPIKTFTNPNAPNEEPGITHYRIFYGKNALFDLKEQRAFASVTDGLSNTMMVFEAEEGVPWTKPDEFEYDPKKPLPKFASFTEGGFHVLLADGSVRFIKNKASEKFLRAIITPAGGELVDMDKQTVQE